MTTGEAGMTVLSTHDCLDLLRRTDVGRVAVAHGEHPEIFPINYVLEHGTVVFRTAPGTKLDALIADRNVTFEADGYDEPSGDAWSVVIKGRAVELAGMHDRFDALDLPLFPWHTSPKQHFVRIVPVETSGRRFHAAGATAPRPDEPTPRRAASE